MKKWIFFFLWLLSIVVFTIGQFLAPPNYSLIPNNPWGNLFGTSVVLGIGFFLIMIFFMFFEKKNKNQAVKTNSKYDLSFKRIFSRLFITGVIGIIFGIAMFPFMRVADGLLYEQRASIGAENILRAIVLWGVFTVIVSLFAFWKKHFRMVSILLISCWIISLVFGGLLLIRDNSSLSCKRSTPYPLNSEFNRVLDLISQRLDIENNYGTYWGNAFNYRNCLDIQYSDESKKLGAEGLFFAADPKLQDLKILINPDYKNYDDLTISTILIHELTHVGQKINETTNKIKSDCFGSEAEAFTSQAIFLSQLNQEEVRSIYARIRENANVNPAFKILTGIEQMQTEAYNACVVLKKDNNLTEKQFNECVWTGTKNKLELEVKADPFYQKECSSQ